MQITCPHCNNSDEFCVMVDGIGNIKKHYHSEIKCNSCGERFDVPRLKYQPLIDPTDEKTLEKEIEEYSEEIEVVCQMMSKSHYDYQANWQEKKSKKQHIDPFCKTIQENEVYVSYMNDTFLYEKFSVETLKNIAEWLMGHKNNRTVLGNVLFDDENYDHKNKVCKLLFKKEGEK